MAQIFNVSATIGDDTVLDFDSVISKWIDLDGVSGVTQTGNGVMENPLHTTETYYVERFRVSDAVLSAVASSSPDIIDLGGAGASSETMPKIIKITHKSSGFYFQIQLNPVTGSTENARLQLTARWGNDTPGYTFGTSYTYSPQSTTIRLYAASRTYSVSGTAYKFSGFIIDTIGGAPITTTNKGVFFTAQDDLYGHQANPLPPTPTQGGGGFGSYDNSTDVTVNIGMKSGSFLAGILGNGFNLYYVPDYSDLVRAAYYSLNGVNNLSDFMNNTAALFLNPSTYIVSAVTMPIDKIAFSPQTMSSTIRLGGLISFNVNCYPLRKLYGDSEIFTFNFRNHEGMYYDDFRDFEPYTKITLYLPYIGFVPLKASECNGGIITVQYRFEGLTGKCICFVKTTDRNGRNTGFHQFNGNAGFSLPWVGNNGGGTQMLHSAANAAVSLIKGENAAISNAAGFAASAAQFLAHDSRPYMQGGFGVNSGALGADEITLFIQRSQNAMPENYYDIHGFQTATGGTVGDYSGYTQFDYIDLEGVDATDTEKEEIEAVMKGGIYL